VGRRAILAAERLAGTTTRGLDIPQIGLSEEQHGSEAHDEGHSPQVGSKLQDVAVVGPARHGAGDP